MEEAGFEPTASALQGQRSTNWAIPPNVNLSSLSHSSHALVSFCFTIHFFTSLNLVGRAGFEPATNWLKVNCSSNWANDPNLVERAGFEPATNWLKVNCSANWANVRLFYLSPHVYSGIKKGDWVSRLLFRFVNLSSVFVLAQMNRDSWVNTPHVSLHYI